MEAAQRAASEFRALFGKTLTKAIAIFDAGLANALAFLRFPIERHWSIATTNPIEHLNKEIRRRTRSIGIFPSRESALRLVTMILIEQSEEWMVERRYMSPDHWHWYYKLSSCIITVPSILHTYPDLASGCS